MVIIHGACVSIAKENVKTASYAGVILFGLGTTCAILYVLYKEVLSSDSPTVLYQVFESQMCQCIELSSFCLRF